MSLRFDVLNFMKGFAFVLAKPVGVLLRTIYLILLRIYANLVWSDENLNNPERLLVRGYKNRFHWLEFVLSAVLNSYF